MRLNRRTISVAAIVFICLIFLVLARTGPKSWMPVETEFGYFTSRPQVEFLDNTHGDRAVKLLDDFTYIDPKGTSWTAPKGYVSDGASIPQVFWSFVGGPFAGAYRDAALIHDQYCDSMEENSMDTHRIFYYANRAAGVSEVNSRKLYLAVLFGGRKWGPEASNCYSGCHMVELSEFENRIEIFDEAENGKQSYQIKVSSDEAAAAISWVERTNPSLLEIEKYVRTATHAHGLGTWPPAGLENLPEDFDWWDFRSTDTWAIDPS